MRNETIGGILIGIGAIMLLAGGPVLFFIGKTTTAGICSFGSIGLIVWGLTFMK